MVLSIIAEWLLCVETQATKNKEIPIYVLQCITSIKQQFLMARSYNFARVHLSPPKDINHSAFEYIIIPQA